MNLSRTVSLVLLLLVSVQAFARPMCILKGTGKVDGEWVPYTIVDENGQLLGGAKNVRSLALKIKEMGQSGACIVKEDYCEINTVGSYYYAGGLDMLDGTEGDPVDKVLMLASAGVCRIN